jgi:CBS domain-containing protein
VIRTVADLMSSPAVTADELTGVKQIATLLAERGFNGVPVTTRMGTLVGIVTEDDLVLRQDPAVRARPGLFSDPHRAERARALGRVARDVMVPSPITVTPQTLSSTAAELMHERHLKTLPVVDEEGVLVGVLTRRDLLSLITRPDEEIADDLDAVLREACVDPASVQLDVSDGTVTLSGWVYRTGEAERLRQLAMGVDGVVAVRLWLNSEELGGTAPEAADLAVSRLPPPISPMGARRPYPKPGKPGQLKQR